MATKFLVNELPKKETDCMFYCTRLCNEGAEESFNCPIVVWDNGEFDRYYEMHECPYLAQLWTVHGYGNTDISENIYYGLGRK